MLPSLLVIGAAKCGTTSLHHYLDSHPDIAMSAEKELNFFVPEINGGRGLDWYESQFDRSAPIRGESSPAYTTHPLFAGVPERIHALIPDVQLLYLVRDPIDRIVSHWRLLQRDPDIGSLAQMLEDPFHGPSMVNVSRYWLQLEQYLRFFSQEQILVVDAEKLRDRRAETLARIFRFLRVDSESCSDEFGRRLNVTPAPTRRDRAGRLVVARLERALGSSRADAIVGAAPRALKAPFRRVVDPPAIGPELFDRLADELRPDVERLRAQTGEAFAGWSL